MSGEVSIVTGRVSRRKVDDVRGEASVSFEAADPEIQSPCRFQKLTLVPLRPQCTSTRLPDSGCSIRQGSQSDPSDRINRRDQEVGPPNACLLFYLLFPHTVGDTNYKSQSHGNHFVWRRRMSSGLVTTPASFQIHAFTSNFNHVRNVPSVMLRLMDFFILAIYLHHRTC